MLVRDVEKEILPFCLKNHIGVIAYSPMRNGLLTGKYNAERIRNLPADDWRHRSSDFNEPRLTANLRLVGSLIEVAKSKGITAAQLAIAWVNANPAVTAAIAGARSAQQVEELAPAADIELTLNDMSAIHRLILERDQALEP
jgi:aryl-alcohol dehydrogenase-like predicted oxidoreductase